MNYATVRFKNSRTAEDTVKLTEAQRLFLDTKLFALGVGGYAHQAETYLFGERADIGVRGKLIDFLPSGLIDPDHDGLGSELVLNGLERELREETGLQLEQDIQTAHLTHLNIGPKYGDFGLLYDLPLAPQAKGKEHINPQEHTLLQWIKKEEINRKISSNERYTFNPVTVSLFEKL